MALQQVLEFERGRYGVLVAATEPSVYEETILTKRYDLSTCEDIELATRTLAQFVKGMAFVLENETSKEDVNSIENVRDRTALRQTMATLQHKGTVKIPDFVADAATRKLKVA